MRLLPVLPLEAGLLPSHEGEGRPEVREVRHGQAQVFVDGLAKRAGHAGDAGLRGERADWPAGDRRGQEGRDAPPRYVPNSKSKGNVLTQGG